MPLICFMYFSLFMVLHLQSNVVEKTKLQLVGVTAMLIASKYEEMYAPEVRDFVYITDNAYTSAAIRSMEQKMLNDLDFSLGNPLCLHFLRRNSRAGDVSPWHVCTVVCDVMVFANASVLDRIYTEEMYTV